MLNSHPQTAVAGRFATHSAPVTLVVDTLSGRDLARIKRCARAARKHGSPVTLCMPPDVEGYTHDGILTALECVGLDCSGIRVAQPGSLRPEVLPRSPLLSPEYACYPWSERELMCPAETAWVPMEISLLRFADDFASIGAALDQLVDLAESIHDDARWPTENMQRDAQLNRRVAIELVDIGRYAAGRSASEMHRCVGWISARLQARSAYWARRRESLPAIRDADPSRGMLHSPMREQWQLRWQAAVASSAVRHRNLLVLSPWSILADSSAQRVELLSLLMHADAICLAPPRNAQTPSAENQRVVERRLRVALQQRHALDQIAKHV